MLRCTYFLVSGQGVDEAPLPVDFLEDDQTLPSLAGVLGHFDVVPAEEESV